MSRMRLILLCLFVAASVSTVALASASAVMPAYTNEAGNLIAGRLETLTTKAAGSGAGILTTTLVTIKVEIECAEAHGTGWLENSAVMGMGLSLELLHYSECKFKKGAAGCALQNKLLLFLLTHDLLLLHPSSGLYLVGFNPDQGTFTAMTWVSCTNEVLNGTYFITGSSRGLVNNTNLTIEFNKTTGSELRLGSSEVIYTDTIKTEMLGGGGIMVENGF